MNRGSFATASFPRRPSCRTRASWSSVSDLGVKLDENWGDAKKMLADTSLLDKLKRYPKDSITEKMMKSVRKYFKNPKMTVENMKSVSKAGQCSAS